MVYVCFSSPLQVIIKVMNKAVLIKAALLLIRYEANINTQLLFVNFMKIKNFSPLLLLLH